MRKHLALLTTVAALAVTPALAQTTPDQSKQPTPQAQPSQPQAPSTSPSTQAPADKSGSPSTTTQAPASPDAKSTAQTPGGAGGEKFVDTQTSGQLLASDVMGMNVVGSNNDNIGSVSDLLMDEQGNIVAAVVGVGGFLGIGQKNVALSFDTLQISTAENGDPQARITLTKEELESAPEFRTQADVKSQTQSPASPGGGGATKPATPR